MNKPIRWSPSSKLDYLNLLDYLEQKWREKTIKKVDEQSQKNLRVNCRSA